jgi:hypothetical protein
MRFVYSVAIGITMAASLPAAAIAADDGRYRIENIQRDIADGNGYRTVNGTMMVDTVTGRTWILDEQKGRWVPVGFRAPNLGSDVTVSPGS